MESHFPINLLELSLIFGNVDLSASRPNNNLGRFVFRYRDPLALVVHPPPWDPHLVIWTPPKTPNDLIRDIPLSVLVQKITFLDAIILVKWQSYCVKGPFLVFDMVVLRPQTSFLAKVFFSPSTLAPVH